MRARCNSWTTTAARTLRAALCAGLVATAAGAKAEEPRELVFLNWSQYIDPALVAKFEASHNARVKMIYFEDEDARDQMLLQSDGEGYDVALLSGRQLANYRARGWLAPVDEGNVPNLKNIEPRWRTLFPAAQGFAAPYSWGTLGIAYRNDLVPGGLNSWKQFFEPGEALKHKIAMTGDPDDTIGMALK